MAATPPDPTGIVYCGPRTYSISSTDVSKVQTIYAGALPFSSLVIFDGSTRTISINKAVTSADFGDYTAKLKISLN